MNGPVFLQEVDHVSYIASCTKDNCSDSISDDLECIREETTCVSIVKQKKDTIGDVISIEKYSSVLKLFRVTAFVLRFVDNLKKNICEEELNLKAYITAYEMKKAETLWIEENQKHLLKYDNYLNLKVNLNLEEDSDGIIRSFSRLKNAKIPFDTKAPVMLDRNQKLADLLVLYYHLKVLHRGVKQTLTELRSKYWITSGRSFVKKIINPCVVCKKLNARPYYYPEKSDLPDFRFDDKNPFNSTGVDYLGPLLCLPIYYAQEKLYKAYIVIYTCAATRAIILDVVHNANASTFISCFKRFISRRGCPSTVISDNGSAFISDDTQNFVSSRLVASVKRCIKKIVGI